MPQTHQPRTIGKQASILAVLAVAVYLVVLISHQVRAEDICEELAMTRGLQTEVRDGLCVAFIERRWVDALFVAFNAEGHPYYNGQDLVIRDMLNGIAAHRSDINGTR